MSLILILLPDSATYFSVEALLQTRLSERMPPEAMEPAARKLHALYACKPGAPLIQREFGFFMCIEAWRERYPELRGQDIEVYCGLEPYTMFNLGQLGWCEAAFTPVFDTQVIEDHGSHELVRDSAGRKVLYFKDRRMGFMPEYVDHPVKDRQTWEENVKWRLNPESPERYADLPARMGKAQACAAKGWMICQNLIGGYMYLRSLIGPGDLLYMFYDRPDLIHDCMQQWFMLTDAVTARHQTCVTIDELFMAEDICYNHGALISPEMMREFLLPYYQQLITNICSRQLDRTRRLHLQIDTDGWAVPVIPIYKQLGMDVMSPFEVASGCDVVDIGRRYPDLIMHGGIDKRVLASGPEAIDREMDRILPVLHARGGFCPTCDHGVPEEVSLANYLHYRHRISEFS